MNVDIRLPKGWEIVSRDDLVKAGDRYFQGNNRFIDYCTWPLVERFAIPAIAHTYIRKSKRLGKEAKHD